MSEKLNKAQMLAAKAKNVSTLTAQWVGTSLSDLTGGDESTVERMHFDETIDCDIVVFGYSLRTGSEGEFAVIAFSPNEGETICSTTNGSTVILRKLKTVGEKNGYPVKGKFIKPQGKKYHDFID